MIVSMGRGSGQGDPAAVAALRVLAGGRDELTAKRQPAMDPVLDRLWMTHRNELERVVERLGKAHRLGMPQVTSLVKRLNRLGAAAGVPASWAVVLKDHPGIGERAHAGFVHHEAAAPWAQGQVTVLEDVFGGEGLIDGMSQGRYLGRRLCELPDWWKRNAHRLADHPAAG